MFILMVQYFFHLMITVYAKVTVHTITVTSGKNLQSRKRVFIAGK